MNPVIVIGPMRSGTSAIARVLQERLGILMDEGPIRRDWRNPNGYYEDHRLKKINKIALDHRKKQFGTGIDTVPIEWITKLTSWIVERDFRYSGNWGFKDPGSVGILKHMHQFFNNPRWIVCNRPIEKIVTSQIEKLKMSRQMAVMSVKVYYYIIERELKGRCSIVDMSRYRSEKELSVVLKRILYGR